MSKVELETFDPSLHSAMLLAWLRQSYVARWWGDADEAMAHAEQSSPEAQAVVCSNGSPVGYMCWQRLSRQEVEASHLADLPEDMVDIDILIGEPDMLGHGIGSTALQLLLERLRDESLVSFAGVGTSVQNVRAMRAFTRAGFRPFRAFEDRRWGACSYFVAEVRRGSNNALHPAPARS